VVSDRSENVQLTDEQRLDWLRLIRSQNIGPRGIVAQTPEGPTVRFTLRQKRGKVVVMPSKAHTRSRHFILIIWRPLWTWLALFAVGTVLAIYQGAVTLFIAPDKRDPWDIWNLLSPLGEKWWVIIIAAIVLLIIFEGSFRAYRALESEKSDLQERLKPRLIPSFSMNEPTCVIHGPFGFPVIDGKGLVRNEVSPARWFRLKVENSGVDSVARCSARLQSVTKEGNLESLTHGERVDLPFIPGNAADSFAREVRNGQEEVLDVLVITDRNVPRIATRSPSPAYDWHGMFMDKGNYILDILLTSENSVALPIRMRFRWTGKMKTAECELVPR